MTYHLQDLTWEETRQRAADGSTFIVLPTGSIEQHGRHLPLEVDTFLVTSVAEAAVKQVAGEVSVLLAPTFWLGLSTHHIGYFAFTLSTEAYIRVITEILEGLVDSGFHRLLVVNGHGGNTDPLRLAVKNVRDRKRALVATVNYWDLATQDIIQIRESGPGGIGHACEFETSMMMHLKREAVRTDHIERFIPQLNPAYVMMDLTYRGPVSIGFKWEDLSPNGVMGDPTLATPEKGRQFFEAAVGRLAGLLREFATWEMTPEGLRL